MLPKRIALLGTLAVLLAAPATAHAYTLGIGDRADADPAATKPLGARVYRVVIDPSRPLASYDHAILSHRAVGQEPQIAIGGTGTKHHASTRHIVSTALKATRRWPFVYSVSVVNEPDLSGMSVCQYARVYRQAYKALKRAGVRRVLFGEFSSHGAVRWTRAAAKCGALPMDGFAWHAYDADPSQEGAINNTASVKAGLRRILGYTPGLFITEYGIITRGPNAARETLGMSHWKRALRIARENGVRELVAWGVHEAPAASQWDSSLVQSNGRKRPAFGVIARASH